MSSLSGSLVEPNLITNQTIDSEVRPILIPYQLRARLAGKGINEEYLFPSGIETFLMARSADVPIRA